ncbi:hypothetical protein BC940DRAFT_301746, partial [Gongronella butleri]
MSSDDDDYMSSAILEQADQYEKKREKTYSQRRSEYLREQAKKGVVKPRKELEKEARDKGLENKIESSNKGMKMLMKMGFKQGSGLGKSQQGVDTPIAIDLKQGRSGLGMDTLMKRKLQEEEDAAMAKVRKLDQAPEDFRLAMASKAKDAKRMRQLTAAVHLAERFDADHDITDNILWVLLPRFEDDNKGDASKPQGDMDNDDATHEWPELPKEAEDDDEKKDGDQPDMHNPASYPPDQVNTLKALPANWTINWTSSLPT